MRLTDVAFPLAALPRLVTLGEQLVTLGGALNRRADDLLALGSRTEKTLATLDEVGRQNAELGAQMLVTARASVEANREANLAIAALTERTDRLLAATDELQAELPALREGMASLEELRLSTKPLGDAAPALQTAAERVERVASRIPGMRD